MNEKKQALESIPDSETITKCIRTPFVQEVNGRLAVNATDGHILLSVYGNEFVNEYCLQEKPACDRVYKLLDLDSGIKTTISVEAIEKVLQKVERNVVVETDEDCEECGCWGVVVWKYEDANGNLHEKEDECPVCQGKGSVHEKLVETYDPKTAIYIGQCYFTAKMLDRVVNILKLLSVTSMKCIVLEDRLVSHNDDFSLIVMGMHSSVAEDNEFKKLNYE